MDYVRHVPAPPLNDYIDDLYYIDGPSPYPFETIEVIQTPEVIQLRFRVVK